jgi:hypothetical protein
MLCGELPSTHSPDKLALAAVYSLLWLQGLAAACQFEGQLALNNALEAVPGFYACSQRQVHVPNPSHEIVTLDPKLDPSPHAHY